MFAYLSDWYRSFYALSDQAAETGAPASPLLTPATKRPAVRKRQKRARATTSSLSALAEQAVTANATSDQQLSAPQLETASQAIQQEPIERRQAKVPAKDDDFWGDPRIYELNEIWRTILEREEHAKVLRAEEEQAYAELEEAKRVAGIVQARVVEEQAYTTKLRLRVQENLQRTRERIEKDLYPQTERPSKRIRFSDT